MNRRPSRPWLIPLLLLLCLLVQPVRLSSQCMIATTSTLQGATFRTVFKVLSTPTTCTRTMSMAFSCNPVGPTFTTGLFASAKTSTTATMSVSCGWNCGCGQVISDGSDGLPVELMSFSVEGVEDVEDEDDP